MVRRFFYASPVQNDDSMLPGQPMMICLSLMCSQYSDLLGQIAYDLEGGQDFLKRIQVCIGDNLHL